MTNDEIVRALRCYASDCDGDETCCQCTFAWMCDEFDGNAPEIIADTLERLAAERDAAVEDLKQHILWNGTACTYCRYCEEAESALSPCDTCEDIPDTKMPTNWKWRGPQAGEGGK